MKKQHLLPLVFVAAAAQGTEPARFQDMLGDTRLSRIEKPGYKISDFDERKESGVRNNLKKEAGNLCVSEDMRWLDSRKVSRLHETSKDVRLDSIVGYDENGDLFTKQVFRFDDNGKLISRVNSIFDLWSGLWTVVEDYAYEWNEKGNIVSEYCIGYGSGLKYEYVYNDQELGVEQLTYIHENGQWEPNAKAEYVYDDEGNIIDEMLYYPSDGDWMPYAHNMATWDNLHRQTSVECMEWNGFAWVGTAKEDYEYYKDHPDMLTYLGRWYWIMEEGRFRLVDKVTQKFDDNAWIIYQGRVFWNEDKKDWSGNYPSWGTDVYTNVYSSMSYDNEGRIISDEAFYDYEGDGNWFRTCKMSYRYDDIDNGDYEMRMDSYLYSYPENTERNDQKRFAKYNSQGKRLWMLQQVLPWNGTELANDYEEKYVYDERGNQVLVMNWSWNGNYRIPQLMMEENYDSESNILGQVSYYGEEGYDCYFETLVGSAEITETDFEGWEYATKFDYGYENGERISKFGWLWNGDEWIANFGSDVSYDFAVPSSRMIVPDGWTDPYKVEQTSNYTASGDAEFIKSTNYYHYTELPNVGVSVTTLKNGLTYDGRLVRVSGAAEVIEIFDLEGCKLAEGISVLTTDGMTEGIYIARSIVAGNIAVLKIVVK